MLVTALAIKWTTACHRKPDPTCDSAGQGAWSAGREAGAAHECDASKEACARLPDCAGVHSFGRKCQLWMPHPACNRTMPARGHCIHYTFLPTMQHDSVEPPGRDDAAQLRSRRRSARHQVVAIPCGEGASAKLVEQTSKTPCISWGAQANFGCTVSQGKVDVWTRGGCRGRFSVRRNGTHNVVMECGDWRGWPATCSGEL